MHSTSWTQQFRSKTHEMSRPARSHARWANAQPDELEAAQQGYDEAQRIDAKLLELSARGIARRADEEAQRRAKQAAFQQQGEQSIARILEPAWRSFQVNGGTREESEAVKPQVLELARMNVAVSAATGVAAHVDAEARLTTTQLFPG